MWKANEYKFIKNRSLNNCIVQLLSTFHKYIVLFINLHIYWRHRAYYCFYSEKMSNYNNKMSLSSVLILMILAGQALCRSSSGYHQGHTCPNTPACICKWSDGKRVADCSNSQLTKVPDTLDSQTQSLILDGNPLLTLGKDVFKSAGLLNIQRLSISQCNLVDVHEDAFRDLKILLELNLSGNNLTKLRPKTFEGNDNLQTIQLTNNPILR